MEVARAEVGLPGTTWLQGVKTVALSVISLHWLLPKWSLTHVVLDISSKITAATHKSHSILGIPQPPLSPSRWCGWHRYREPIPQLSCMFCCFYSGSGLRKTGPILSVHKTTSPHPDFQWCPRPKWSERVGQDPGQAHSRRPPGQGLTASPLASICEAFGWSERRGSLLLSLISVLLNLVSVYMTLGLPA